jgi:hypothetical protein
MSNHDVRIYPQEGRDDFFATCLTASGSCQFEVRGEYDEMSAAVREHRRRYAS